MRRKVCLPGVLLGVIFLLTACGVVRPAEMALPAGLAGRVETVPIVGIGGWQSGDFQVAQYRGTFTRSESRLDVFGIWDRRAGSVAYTLSGPEIDGRIEADCRMRAHAITVGVIAFDPSPMAFRCEFTTNSRPFPARLEVQEARAGLAGALSQVQRRGEIALDRVVLQIRSSHELQGSPLDLAYPIGYVFEQGGVPVGAVELNGTPRLFLPHSADVPLRRAIIAAATALAIFWDPAASDL